MKKFLQHNYLLSIFASFFLLFFALPNKAQEFSAKNEYSQKSLQEAIKQYLKAVKSDPYNGEALFNLANSYRLNSEFRKAEIWFAKAVQIDERPESYLYYAQMLLSNGKYIEASTWFRRYAAQESGTSNEQNALKLAEYAKQLAEEGLENKDYLIQKMGFNSQQLDFSPMFFADSALVFASNRNTKNDKDIDRWTNQAYVDLYVVKKNEAETAWTEPEPFSSAINSKLHEGSVTFNRSYDVIYFTRNDYGKKGRGFDKEKNTRLKIFQSELAGEGWTTPTELPFNNNEYHCAHPALAKDTTYLVFASDMPGGYGQMDLYMVWLQDGEWGEPMNLGSEINTSGNEVFPYLDENGALFFSSDLHVGLGGLDIFKAVPRTGNNQALGQWYNPVNMGAPLNGNRDDFGIIVDETGNAGYFTSNRSGRGDDIYSFEMDEMVSIVGTVINCKDSVEIGDANVVVNATSSGEEIVSTKSNADGSFVVSVPKKDLYNFKATKEGFGFCAGGCDGTTSIDLTNIKSDKEIRVLLSFCPENPCQLTTSGPVINNECDKPMAGATVTLVNKCTGERQSTITGPDGYYDFDVDEDCEYILVAEKDGFFRQATEFTTTKANCGDVVKSQVDLDFDNSEFEEMLGNGSSIEEGTVIELYNVYFDLDKYNIRPDAQVGLNDVYQLMIDYPEMKGEIRAHTDSRQTFQYNETLSDNRAKSAMSYLINRGISADRLTWKGYGEYVLKNECADNVPCTEKQHQRNRRVEFAVTYFEGTVNSKEYETFLIGDDETSSRR